MHLKSAVVMMVERDLQGIGGWVLAQVRRDIADFQPAFRSGKILVGTDLRSQRLGLLAIPAPGFLEQHAGIRIGLVVQIEH